jgi:plastocyanin
MRLQLMTLAVGLGLGACGVLGSTGTSASTNSTEIGVGNNFFFPQYDTLVIGTDSTVTVDFLWTTPSNCHQVAWDSGPAPLPPESQLNCGGLDWPVTLRLGTYHYHCTQHLNADPPMVGTIVVVNGLVNGPNSM